MRLLLSKMYKIILITFYITININPLFSLNTSNTKETIHFSKPVIIESPTDLITNENILEFTCKAEANPKPLIIWYNATTNQPLEDKLQTSGYQTSIHVNKHLGKLMISNPVPGKSYSIYCNASNSIGWVTTNPPVIGAVIYLNFEFNLNPSDTEANEGTSVTLECLPPKGLPKPKISWIKDNKTVISQDKVQNLHGLDFSNLRIMPNGSLRIHPANIKDTGNYICVAMNPIGQRLSQSAYLRINSLPHKHITPKHIRVRQGQQVKLICPTNNDKSIEWSRQSKQPFTISERIQQIKEALIINRVIHSDSDIYICTTLNGEQGEIHLTVETPPIFLKSPIDLILNIGDKAKFVCVANGNPKPGIYWELPDKTPIFPTDNSSTQSINRHIVHTDGTLEIDSVTLKDAGKYHCIAHSSIDMIQTSAVLRIRRKKKNTTTMTTTTNLDQHQNVNQFKTEHKLPSVKHSIKSVNYVPPYIGLPPSNKTQVIGESVLMDCELPKLVKIIHPNKFQDSHHYNNNLFNIQSTENWRIIWRRSSFVSHNNLQQQHPKEIIHGEDDRFIIFQSGSLQITDLQLNDSGLYTCSLKDDTNIKYEVTVTLNVLSTKLKEQISDSIEEYPLNSPTNLQLLNQTEQSITLSWMIPHINNYNQSLLSINYWIEIYSPNISNQGWFIIERNWPINMITLNNLNYNQLYYIIIRCRLYNGRIGWASYPFGPILLMNNNNNNNKINNQFNNQSIINQKSIKLINIQLNVLSFNTIQISFNLYEQLYILLKINGYIIYYRSVEHMKCLHTTYNHYNNSNIINHYCSLNPKNYNPSISYYDIYKRLKLMNQLYQEEEQEQQQQQQQQQQEQDNITDSINSLHGIISTVTIEEKNFSQKNYTNNQLNQLINHKVITLLTKLKSFHCYEIGIKIIYNHILMNYIHHTTDIFTHKILTYETNPLSPPRNIYITWLYNNHIEISWIPPLVSDWNGILLGYIIYIHNELLNIYHSINVSSDSRKFIINLNKLPKLINIQLAAYTCIGIGIKSELIKINFNHLNISQINKESTTLTTVENVRISTDSMMINYSMKNLKLINQPWFIGTMISSLLAWCILFSICLLCWIRRNKFCKKHLTYKITQPNFQYLTTVDSKDCKSKTNNIDTKSIGQCNSYSNHHLNNISMMISSSLSEQTYETKIHPKITYLPVRQSLDYISNDNSNSYGLQYTKYSDESHMKFSSKMDHFRTVNDGIRSPINNNNHSVIPQLVQTFTKQFIPNSSKDITYLTSDIHDPIKTNSSHFISGSQTSSEPFDSAIYLEQISNRQHFNDSSGSILIPSTIMTTINSNINEQIYSPIVTPYATVSIIQNQNCNLGLQSPKKQTHFNNQNNNNHHSNNSHNNNNHHHHFNDNTSQNMYITCMDLTNCQKAINIPSSL
ncbi:unnamed protein product [Schistosoma rodhaini]|uniref:Interference hedgehog-like n=1 Tax=Schistosoma rodhaini TaxID=6188 RepID=A0AA85G0Z9_9TREM|nr:unnamed protein product [Schistosoma rodhaini]